MNVSLVVDPRNMLKLMHLIPPVLDATLDKATVALGASIMDDQARHMSGGSVNELHLRTGQFVRSRFSTLYKQNGQGSRTLVCGFAGVPYANVQEHGATIVPKTRQWLAIPAKGGPVVLGTGVSRASPRMYPGLRFMSTSKPNTALLVMPNTQRSGGKRGLGRNASTGRFETRDRSRGIVYFILKKNVVIPPRLGFYARWRSWFTSGRAGRGINVELAKAVKALNEGTANATPS